MQSWRKRKQEMSQDTWSTFTVCRDDTRRVLNTQCAAGIDLHHLFKSLSSTHTWHASLHSLLYFLLTERQTQWFTAEVVSGLASAVFAFTSEILCLSFQSLFYLAERLLRSEERISGSSQVCVQSFCHSAVASKWEDVGQHSEAGSKKSYLLLSRCKCVCPAWHHTFLLHSKNNLYCKMSVKNNLNYFWLHRQIHIKPNKAPGKTVLLSCTAKCIHLCSLNVRGCLDVVRVRNQVWKTCRGKKIRNLND